MVLADVEIRALALTERLCWLYSMETRSRSSGRRGGRRGYASSGVRGLLSPSAGASPD
jgi:hypothetical protein